MDRRKSWRRDSCKGVQSQRPKVKSNVVKVPEVEYCTKVEGDYPMKL